jgi:putative tricarboxylic transport membrane protein
MWIGRYRRIGVVLATSAIGALAFMFMFMKVVYVSLPLGVEPFAQVSFALMRIMGIK